MENHVENFNGGQGVYSTDDQYYPCNVVPEKFQSGTVEKSRWLCRSGSPDLGSSFCRLRAHRPAALRGVRAHVRSVRSARQKGCGLPFDPAQGRTGQTLRKGEDFFEHSLPLMWGVCHEAFMCKNLDCICQALSSEVQVRRIWSRPLPSCPVISAGRERESILLFLRSHHEAGNERRKCWISTATREDTGG